LPLRLAGSPCKRLVDKCRAEVNPSGEREYQRHQQREPHRPPPTASLINPLGFPCSPIKAATLASPRVRRCWGVGT
jgi:hypothetical protein